MLTGITIASKSIPESVEFYQALGVVFPEPVPLDRKHVEGKTFNAVGGEGPRIFLDSISMLTDIAEGGGSLGTPRTPSLGPRTPPSGPAALPPSSPSSHVDPLKSPVLLRDAGEEGGGGFTSPVIAPPPRVCPVTMAFQQRQAEDVDDVFQAALDAAKRINDNRPEKERSYQVTKRRPFDAIWGQRYASLVDPDGNQVDLFADRTPLEQCVAKMRAAEITEACIAQFSSQHKIVNTGATCLVPEADIQPPKRVIDYEDLSIENPRFLKEAVYCKLNGGLATTMGLSKAKSLLEVKGDETFLDFICKQVLHVRNKYKQPLKFMLMNSFSTSLDTKEFLEKKYPELAENYHQEVEILQNKVPKICQDTLEPATYDEDPACEWVPPGHGDFYAALIGTGQLDKLLADGFKYMFVSNSDNLAATMDLKLLTEFASKKYDFMLEVADRTLIDMKGSHLAQYKDTGRYLVRELNQCVAGEEDAFRNIRRHRLFNTNNLWINLPALKAEMTRNGGFMNLPVVINKKTVCPTDKASTKVFQLETAIGTAITVFPHAYATRIPRTRFAPVKTCNDLLAVRSDCYNITDDFRLVLDESRGGEPPIIELDATKFNFYNMMKQLTPQGTPSLLGVGKLTVKGPLVFSKDLVLSGDVNLESQAQVKEDGTEEGGGDNSTDDWPVVKGRFGTGTHIIQ